MKYLTPILLLLFFQSSLGTVYKCVDEAGTIHYQERVCDSDKEESVVKIRKAPVVEFKEEKPSRKMPYRNADSNMDYEKQMRELEEDSRIQRCKIYFKQYSKLKKQVKNRCKKDKDTYCDLPGDQIEERNYQRDLTFSNRDGRDYQIAGINVTNNRAMSGRIRKPPLLKLKDRMSKVGCL